MSTISAVEWMECPKSPDVRQNNSYFDISNTVLCVTDSYSNGRVDKRLTDFECAFAI